MSASTYAVFGLIILAWSALPTATMAQWEVVESEAAINRFTAACMVNTQRGFAAAFTSENERYAINLLSTDDGFQTVDTIWKRYFSFPHLMYSDISSMSIDRFGRLWVPAGEAMVMIDTRSGQVTDVTQVINSHAREFSIADLIWKSTCIDGDTLFIAGTHYIKAVLNEVLFESVSFSDKLDCVDAETDWKNNLPRRLIRLDQQTFAAIRGNYFLGLEDRATLWIGNVDDGWHMKGQAFDMDLAPNSTLFSAGQDVQIMRRPYQEAALRSIPSVGQGHAIVTVDASRVILAGPTRFATSIDYGNAFVIRDLPPMAPGFEPVWRELIVVDSTAYLFGVGERSDAGVRYGIIKCSNINSLFSTSDVSEHEGSGNGFRMSVSNGSVSIERLHDCTGTCTLRFYTVAGQLECTINLSAQEWRANTQPDSGVHLAIAQCEHSVTAKMLSVVH